MLSRLDSPSKRVFSLLMVTGIIMLAISMGSFFSSSNRHLLEFHRQWAYRDPGAGGKKNYYTIDSICAAPLASAEVDRAKANKDRAQADLAAHLAAEPKSPDPLPTDSGRFYSATAPGHVEWAQHLTILKVEAKGAERALDAHGGEGSIILTLVRCRVCEKKRCTKR